MTGGRGNRINGFRLKSNGERSVLGRDMRLLDELLSSVAAPNAELSGGQATTDVARQVLYVRGVLGLDDHAVIFARGFEGDEGAAVGKLPASAIEILPPDFRELSVMGVAPMPVS